MKTNEGIAATAIDVQKGERDYALLEIPAYMPWSERKLLEGESEALIAHLDATSMWLSPEQLQTVTESDFEELLSELKETLGNAS
ncbi:hypothetical protein [Undibacterium umbellatum]|uniref:Uncharacterized protein n=1 Tax=Undibacterium umbellatum TaxID=2762300 RepID=A0ABR6Z5U3_9BURK|nr:hypothetical protein [Undibacterium umbellatum]MBC3907153.1 hypothetical protein [Undibacterium umbellatum]